MIHRYGEGPPVLFETMIFGGPTDEDQWRYISMEEAIVGHELALSDVNLMINQNGKSWRRAKMQLPARIWSDRWRGQKKFREHYSKHRTQ